MKASWLLVLLWSLWSGGLGLTHTRAPGEDDNAPENGTSAFMVLEETQDPQTLPSTHVVVPEKATTPESRTARDSLQNSTQPPRGPGDPPEGMTGHTFSPPGQRTEQRVLGLATLSPLGEPPTQPSPRAELGVLSNSTLRFLQSFARMPRPQATSQTSGGSPGGLGDRYTRHIDLSRGDSSRLQRASHQKPSFETTRGKNWCAYVHSRLSPTVILDNQAMYVSSGAGPCGWARGSCSQRPQKVSRPVYRMQHKIVTSLEWKCCPGFSGAQCEMKAQDQQHLLHSSQAESHTAAGRGTLEEQQMQDCRNPEVAQKLADQMNQQAVRMNLLQKQMDNISLAVSDFRSTYSSLEEKLNEDKGREVQSFLKVLKSKSMSDFVKDVVREQLQIFQNEMQETVAQLFKTVSRLSEDLENTRQSIQQVNESLVLLAAQQQSILKEEKRPTSADILDLKNQVVNISKEMAFTCVKPIKELMTKQAVFQGALEMEHTRSLLYFESLNQTLVKMKAVHEHLLSEAQAAGPRSVPTAETINSNATAYLSTLQEDIRRQGLLVLQVSDSLYTQENKINSLTLALEREKEAVREECENMVSKCRSDFKFQIQDTEENVQVLNQTLAEVLFPMDSRLDKMDEQLSDLTYDMEILQPLLERGMSFRETKEQPKEEVATKRKVDNLTSAVNSLNVLVKELTRRHNLLRNEVQGRADALDRRIMEYASELDDGLNKTMTVINNAMDFIRDNYMLKVTLSTMKGSPDVHHKCPQNMETVLAFLAQFQHLNNSIHTLVNDSQRYDFVLQVVKELVALIEDKHLSQLSFQKIYRMFNETTLQMMQWQEHMNHLEEKVLSDTKLTKNLDIRLQDMESKVTKILIPYFVSLKKNGKSANERNHTLQLQVLTSRFKALEAKSIHLSINLSLLNKTLHDTSAMCYHASEAISELNATLPGWIKASLPDIQFFQKGLTEFVGLVVERRTQAVILNLTEYINQSLSSSLANVLKSQTPVKPLMKKANILKKPTVNVTTIIVGRAQRNTDRTIIPATAEERFDCTASPCQNGGTCINGKNSFICACRHPFTGDTCTVKLVEGTASAPDFSKGSYRYAPMVAFFASHTYGMTTPGPILFNNLDVNYGASYTPRTGRFSVPYLGVYIFKYTIESFSAHTSGFLVVDGVDKLAFESENTKGEEHCDRVLTGDALLELNYGQEVWLRLVKGTIPARFPPATTFSGYLLYRT
ncbi:multimerin-1 [Erinaceus europaeus]|uniref:Multimerin-1 n=1 Tax=Erinaceus europaeus TaxID=9365 RepID=A0ABM3X4H1_ERIEU|nr:multimerin-1 [Erinaceus europaeus]XP_060043719.1 multimerin-1 [Erinaceus europaeus]